MHKASYREQLCVLFFSPYLCASRCAASAEHQVDVEFWTTWPHSAMQVTFGQSLLHAVFHSALAILVNTNSVTDLWSQSLWCWKQICFWHGYLCCLFEFLTRHDHVCIANCFNFVHVKRADDGVERCVQVVQQIYHLKETKLLFCMWWTVRQCLGTQVCDIRPILYGRVNKNMLCFALSRNLDTNLHWCAFWWKGSETTNVTEVDCNGIKLLSSHRFSPHQLACHWSVKTNCDIQQNIQPITPNKNVFLVQILVLMYHNTKRQKWSFFEVNHNAVIPMVATVRHDLKLPVLIAVVVVLCSGMVEN